MVKLSPVVAAIVTRAFVQVLVEDVLLSLGLNALALLRDIGERLEVLLEGLLIDEPELGVALNGTLVVYLCRSRSRVLLPGKLWLRSRTAYSSPACLTSSLVALCPAR